jgi:hypothetical protein
VRKPPSVALAAIALDAGPINVSLVDEVISVATAIRTKLLQKDGPRGTVQVRNPAYDADEFTDRWPENVEAQNIFDGDLRRLIVALHRLKNDELSLSDKRELLQGLFGETAASYAMDSYLDARRHEMEAGRLHAGPKGKIASAAVAAPAVVGARTTAARPATREGGGYLPE